MEFLLGGGTPTVLLGGRPEEGQVPGGAVICNASLALGGGVGGEEFQ